MERYRVDLKYRKNIYKSKDAGKDYLSTHKTIKSAKEEFDTLAQLLQESEPDRSFDCLQLIDRVRCMVLHEFTSKNLSK